MKKPIDIEKIRRFVEHCERCMAMFLRGFFDSEGSVSKNGYITSPTPTTSYCYTFKNF
jgi:DNA transposition AAA+ family ATPase